MLFLKQIVYEAMFFTTNRHFNELELSWLMVQVEKWKAPNGKYNHHC